MKWVQTQQSCSASNHFHNKIKAQSIVSAVSKVHLEVLGGIFNERF